MYNKFNLIKTLLLIIIFVPIQFNNSHLHFLEEFSFNKKIHDYQDYIKIKFLSENVVNYSAKIELKSHIDNNKRIFSDKDFTATIFIPKFLLTFLKNEIYTDLKINLKNKILLLLNPRAPPFSFPFN